MNNESDLLSGDALRAKVQANKRKKWLNEIELNAVYLMLIAGIIALAVFGYWILAISLLLLCIAALLSI